MSDPPFLFVDDEPISQTQVVDPLRSAGQQQDWSMQLCEQQVSQLQLYEHFIRRKLALDQVVLSCIVMQNEIPVSELYAKKSAASLYDVQHNHSFNEFHEKERTFPAYPATLCEAELVHYCICSMKETLYV